MDAQVTYTEMLPDVSLQSIIYCYWELKTTQRLSSPFIYRVVADGCMDIFFERNAPQESFVMGFANQHTAFPLEGCFHYVGVRFLPTMFPQLFKVDASALCDRVERLDDVMPLVAADLSNIFQWPYSEEQMKTKLDRYFMSLLSRANLTLDQRLYQAVQVILT